MDMLEVLNAMTMVQKPRQLSQKLTPLVNKIVNC